MIALSLRHWLLPLIAVASVGLGLLFLGGDIPAAVSWLQPFFTAVNPDPNHIHADFAVWINGKTLDFSGPEYMSGSSTDENTHPTAGLRQYLHLHDGNGQVIHAHKQGLTLGDFFRSIGVVDSKDQSENLCLQFPQNIKECQNEADHRTWIMKLADGEQGMRSLDFNYVFADGDKMLIVLPQSGNESEQLTEIDSYWERMTDDACLYSQTCPWRGEPPTENCIADPAMPCVQ